MRFLSQKSNSLSKGLSQLLRLQKAHLYFVEVSPIQRSSPMLKVSSRISKSGIFIQFG